MSKGSANLACPSCGELIECVVTFGKSHGVNIKPLADHINKEHPGTLKPDQPENVIVTHDRTGVADRTTKPIKDIETK